MNEVRKTEGAAQGSPGTADHALIGRISDVADPEQTEQPGLEEPNTRTLPLASPLRCFPLISFTSCHALYCS